MAEEAAAGKPAILPKVIGRYALFGEIASGGMATVHFGRLVGPVGFSRTVAIKRLHPQYAKDPEFVGMFLDEARLASRVQHPNVVTTLDVVNMPNEVFLVMEYVAGESLSKLVRNASKEHKRLPPSHVVSVIAGMLHGLHAAHEAKSERREPLNIVHRDISPQNVLVGVDGVARVLDFGVAKAAMRSQSTRDGQMKGKLSYMSPEQLNGKPVDRRTDLFAAAVVLWEALTGRRLFDGSDAGEIFAKVVAAQIPEPKSIVKDLPDSLNAVVMKGLERNPDRRYQTAREFAIDLEGSIQVATGRTVGEWVERFAGPDLERRLALVADIESLSTSLEDLERMEAADGIETLPELPEQLLSAVQPVPGTRPVLPPPPRFRSRVEGSEPPRGSSSVPGTSTLQGSNLAVPQTHPPAGPKSGTAIAVGAVVASLAGGVLAFFVFGLDPRGGVQGVGGGTVTSPAPVSLPATAPAPVETHAPLAAPSSANELRAPPAETSSVEALPAAPPSAMPRDEADKSAAAVAARRANVPAVVVKRTTKPAAGTPTATCDPPFTVDSNGIKRLKPNCI